MLEVSRFAWSEKKPAFAAMANAGVAAKPPDSAAQNLKYR